ncbi:MAG: DUF1073 domain-containing protein, partial [PVC group bacterium]|nr:DUF1073 domain-containing protein [PVC group bacterium]
MGVRGKDGKFTRSEDAQIDAEKRRNEAGKEYGFNMRAQGDYQEEMQHQLEKAGLYKDVKVNKYGFGEDFMNFLGLTTPRDFHTPLSDVVKEKLATDFTEDAREFFTPVDDMYGSPGGQDMVSSYGRVPVNHLMVLASQRLGVVYRGCHGTADDVFRNRFDFVSVDDHNKVIKRPEIFKWMRRSFFWDKMVECFDFEMRSGLGHLIAYYPNEKNIEKIGNKAPKSRPDSWEALSAYWMTPNNLQDDMKLDYDKQLWDFTGGVRSISNIHHSRVHVLETRRIEGGLRGSALAELCWVPLMCYLNTSYYILKGLAQMGTHYLVFNSAKEYPTPTETQAYINLANLMRANQTIVLGKNAEFKLQNAAGKIGSGLNEYLEFLKEDVSSAWIIPKNQLFGRSDGGGMDGAGALISKEDYLASNLSTKQLAATNDIMYILEEMCGFPDLEDITLRWNLDMHKTEQQRLTEQIMAEQLEQAKVQTKTAKMMLKLQKHQVDLQIEMAEVQKKMMKENPKQFMETSEKDEENLKE